jgi:cell division protein FtsA
MPKEQIIIGLDIGTCAIRTVVAKFRSDKEKPQIIGVGEALSFGLRKGVVFDIEETVKNITESVQEAERSSGIPIESVSVSISGNHIASKTGKGVVAVSRADGEVSPEDVERVIHNASMVSVSPNREIFHVLPRSFSVDGQEGIKDPVGMNGIRLEVDVLTVEGSAPFIKNLTKCISEAGLEIEELVLAPLAASQSVLSKRQKELGVLVLDLGGGTSGLTVFEESDIIHSCILPVGSSHITNDIAIGLRSSIDLAEKVKVEYGSALISEVSKKDIVNLSKLKLEEKGTVQRVEVVNIIEARLREIMDLVNKELKRIDRQGLLPGGVVLLGGGSKMPGLVDLAKEELKLPAQIGFPSEIEGINDKVNDPSFATAIGLIIWSMEKRKKRSGAGINIKGFSVGSTVGKLKKWFGGFMP